MGMAERQKLLCKSLTKAAHQRDRQELQNLSEITQTVCDLEDVLRRLKVVNRQLVFAADLQAQSLQECERRFEARGRRIRKLELALYAVVAQAQCADGLDGIVASIVQK